MYITLTNENGRIQININEIEYFVEEIIKMTPGVHAIGYGKITNKIKSILSGENTKTVVISPLNDSEIGINCHVIINDSANIKDITKRVNNIIKFSVEKEYEIHVSYVDVHIEGVK